MATCFVEQRFCPLVSPFFGNQHTGTERRLEALSQGPGLRSTGLLRLRPMGRLLRHHSWAGYRPHALPEELVLAPQVGWPPAPRPRSLPQQALSEVVAARAAAPTQPATCIATPTEAARRGASAP